MGSLPKSLMGAFARGAVLALTIAALGSVCLAQDAARVKAGLNVWKSAGCPDCHGPFADGDKQVDEAPTGANLRTSRLDVEQLTETIRCGRPGTGMPAFDEGAYETRGCYGQPPGDRPDAMEPPPRTLSLAEINDVVVYLKARVMGRGRITAEECAAYYEDDDDASCP
jgi:mono/diheme cytochrome c family protein